MPHWIAQLWVNADRTPLRMGQTLGDEKSVWNPRKKVLSLFDVNIDPFEEKPLMLSEGDSLYNTLKKPLNQWFKATNLSDGKSRMNERDVEILKSLGYVQ